MLIPKNNIRIIFYFLFVSLFLISCEKEKDLIKNPKNEFELSNDSKKQIEFLNNFYSQHFFTLLSRIEETRVDTKNIIYDANKVQKLSNEIINKSGISFESGNYGNPNLKVSTILNTTQDEILSNFQNKLTKINSPEDAMKISEEVRLKIDNSILNPSEKFQIFSVTEYVYVSAKYFSESLHIYTSNNSKNSPNLRGTTFNCNVSWREVFATGVATGIVSGTVTGYTAGTTGTIVVPVVGTVTGAAAGFMVGFAGGFLSGAATDIIKSLILTCGQPKKIVAKKYEGCTAIVYTWNNFSLLINDKNSTTCPPPPSAIDLFPI